jgi:cytochrome c-type biogenesis protein CcmH/NrfG
MKKVSFCLIGLSIFILPIESSAQSKQPAGTMVNQMFTCLGSPRGMTSVRELQIPQKALEACNRGTQKFASKDSAGSIVEFRKAIKAYPGYYEAYAKMGAADLDLNDLTDAESAFRRSIELSGGRYAPADFGLGLILATLKDQFDDAEKVIRDGLSVDPEDVTGHFVLAWVLYSTSRLREAEKSAEQAVLSAPNFVGARMLLGQIHIAEKNFAAAVSDLNACLEKGVASPLDAKVRQARDEAMSAISAGANAAAIAKDSGGAEQAGLR